MLLCNHTIIYFLKLWGWLQAENYEKKKVGIHPFALSIMPLLALWSQTTQTTCLMVRLKTLDPNKFAEVFKSDKEFSQHSLILWSQTIIFIIF